ncbi:MAG: Uma2 family endonuclease [Microscillaceae bacterium]|jgi:Uma2 family endonuclease|nr:Uma2 family endonuclease [Microscillaceae bacterium]
MFPAISEEVPAEFFNEEGEIIYPDSDGKRMADNTKQFEWIVLIKDNLESIFKNQTDVFVAGDLLWYPVEGKPQIRVAPDVMVAFGRPKGHRGSYQQWKEDNIPPQVVFEILSINNTAQEMNRKWRFYQRFGVEEYYIYDPDDNDLNVWTRHGSYLVAQMTDPEWVSPLLQVKFVLQKDTLSIYDPQEQPFLTYVEQVNAKEQAEKEKEQAEKEKEAAIQREQKAEKEKEQAEKEKEQAEKEKEQAEKEKEQAEKEKEEVVKQLEDARQEEALALQEKEAEIARLKALLLQSGLTVE